MSNVFPHRPAEPAGLNAGHAGLPMGKNTVETRRWCFALGCALIISAIGTWVSDQQWMESLEHRSYHGRFLLRRQRPLHPDVRLVAIARTDQEILNLPWPWPREVHAQMLQVLSGYAAASVAWDIVFLEPREEEGDKALKTVAAQTPRCVFGFLFQIERTTTMPPPRSGLRLSDFAIRAEQPGDESLYTGAELQWPMPGLELPGKLGFLNILEERGGVIIRAPLVMRYKGYVFPSLSLLAVSEYLGVKPDSIKVKPGRWVRLESGKYGRFTVPIDRQGRMFVNYYGGTSILDKNSDHYAEVLAQQAQAGDKRAPELEAFKNKLVLIGATDPLRKDLGTTPLEENFPRVGIHASVASNILERNFITRAPHGANNALLVVLTCLVAAATAWRSLSRGGLIAATVFVAYGSAAHLCFALGNLWINVVDPLGCMAATYASVLTYRFFVEELEKARTRRWLIRYLSPEIVEEALRTPESLVFMGALRKITVVLSDIRDFTPMTEEMGPQAVVEMLNEYFTVMTRVIQKHGGSVNQFVGDEILAVFGAPISRPDDAQRAVRVALEMQEELGRLMATWAVAGRRTFDIGIAVNTGAAVVGNIGSLEHMDYAVMGDTINYAARLESLTKEYKTRILLSHSTYQEVKDMVLAESLGPVRVKGRKETEEIHKLIGLKT